MTNGPVSSERQRDYAAARPDIEVEVIRLPPVFLLGERTDRSRLATLLDGRQGISCAPDSDLLVELAAAARRTWPSLIAYGYPEQYWTRRIALFFDAIQTEYAASRRLVRWAASARPADLPLIDRLFPRCQVVRVLPERGVTRSSAQAKAAAVLGSRRLSARYYQINAADFGRERDAALAGVLGFLDDVEVQSRP